MSLWSLFPRPAEIRHPLNNRVQRSSPAIRHVWTSRPDPSTHRPSIGATSRSQAMIRRSILAESIPNTPNRRVRQHDFRHVGRTSLHEDRAAQTLHMGRWYVLNDVPFPICVQVRVKKLMNYHSLRSPRMGLSSSTYSYGSRPASFTVRMINLS